jgi:hypothetical protein
MTIMTIMVLVISRRRNRRERLSKRLMNTKRILYLRERGAEMNPRAPKEAKYNLEATILRLLKKLLTKKS